MDDSGVASGSAPSSPPSFDERVLDLAALIEVGRREATMEGRLAAVSLTLFPVVVATLLLAFDPNTAAALDGGVGWMILMAAAALTAAGAWWLWRIAAPPFAAFPQRRSILERQPRTAYELSAILQQAASYADDGIDVVEALDRAAPDEASHPTRVLARALRVLLEPGDDGRTEDGDGGAEPSDEEDEPSQADERSQAEDDEPDLHDPSDLDADASSSGAEEARSELPDWLITTLQRGWTDSDPVETLNLLAVRIRAELEAAAQAWPGRVRIAALVPFAICILPAAVLVALLAFV